MFASRGDDVEETPEERIEEFKEGLIQALAEHIEDFADNTASYELMLTYLRQGE